MKTNPQQKSKGGFRTVLIMTNGIQISKTEEMVAEIWWPKEKLSRLGIQIALFRNFQSDKRQYLEFHRTFFGGSVMIPEMINSINSQIFIPMHKDLRRYIIEEYEAADELEVDVPASDRAVSLNHNSQPYKDAIKALDDVVKAVKESNEYEDVKDKDRRLAELEAGKRVLEAETASLRTVMVLLGGTLKWLADKFVGGLISATATLALPLIVALFAHYL